MIELTNIENKVSFICEIIGYEFPDIPDNDGCLLRVRIKEGDNFFEVVDPALEATELIYIFEWFQSLSKNRLPRYAHLTFTEPCISFNYLSIKDDIIKISVELSHELKPDFKLDQFGFYDFEWDIVFELSSVDFKQILKSINTTILKYPRRGKSDF